jgi:hypothetical protein
LTGCWDGGFALLLMAGSGDDEGGGKKKKKVKSGTAKIFALRLGCGYGTMPMAAIQTINFFFKKKKTSTFELDGN